MQSDSKTSTTAITRPKKTASHHPHQQHHTVQQRTSNRPHAKLTTRFQNRPATLHYTAYTTSLQPLTFNIHHTQLHNRSHYQANTKPYRYSNQYTFRPNNVANTNYTNAATATHRVSKILHTASTIYNINTTHQ